MIPEFYPGTQHTPFFSGFPQIRIGFFFFFNVSYLKPFSIY